MPSTVIRRFDYRPDRRELWIEFVTGRRYVYEDVPDSVAGALRSAFAKGVYFNTRIRERYRHREVTSGTQPNLKRRERQSRAWSRCAQARSSEAAGWRSSGRLGSSTSR